MDIRLECKQLFWGIQPIQDSTWGLGLLKNRSVVNDNKQTLLLTGDDQVSSPKKKKKSF